MGAQVEAGLSRKEKPTSSRKAICAPICEAFFYPGPVALEPGLHQKVTAFARRRRRLLHTPVQAMQTCAEIVSVVMHAELLRNHALNADERPAFRWETGRLCSLVERLQKLLPLCCIQARFATGMKTAVQCFLAALGELTRPDADGSSADAQMTGDLCLRKMPGL